MKLAGKEVYIKSHSKKIPSPIILFLGAFLCIFLCLCCRQKTSLSIEDMKTAPYPVTFNDKVATIKITKFERKDGYKTVWYDKNVRQPIYYYFSGKKGDLAGTVASKVVKTNAVPKQITIVPISTGTTEINFGDWFYSYHFLINVFATPEGLAVDILDGSQGAVIIHNNKIELIEPQYPPPESSLEQILMGTRRLLKKADYGDKNARKQQ